MLWAPQNPLTRAFVTGDAPRAIDELWVGDAPFAANVSGWLARHPPPPPDPPLSVALTGSGTPAVVFKLRRLPWLDAPAPPARLVAVCHGASYDAWPSLRRLNDCECAHTLAQKRWLPRLRPRLSRRPQRDKPLLHGSHSIHRRDKAPSPVPRIIRQARWASGARRRRTRGRWRRRGGRCSARHLAAPLAESRHPPGLTTAPPPPRWSV